MSIQGEINGFQYDMYLSLNRFSQSNKTLGRFCSIPVSLAEVALDVFSTPLNAIEYVARAAISLIRAIFSGNITTFKTFLKEVESALNSVAQIPVKVLFAPVKFIFQSVVIIIDPQRARPFHALNPYTW